MSDPDQPPTPDDLPGLLEEGDQAESRARLDRLSEADAEARKRGLRAVRNAAE